MTFPQPAFLLFSSEENLARKLAVLKTATAPENSIPKRKSDHILHLPNVRAINSYRHVRKLSAAICNIHYFHSSLPSHFISVHFYSSSVTPHSTTKVHPVMSKLQAHMALAALSQNQHGSSSNSNKLKHVHRQNTGSSQEFSPPSQIVSSYANYETATRAPVWHHGFPTKSTGHSGDFHHHVHKAESHKQQQQQILPSVHPSIITPFLEQVHLKQMEVAAAAEQKNSYKHSHESSSIENNGSFEVVNDVFSKHLVPPPVSTSKTHYKQKPAKTTEKHPKINLSMQSPLQDASRFNYNNVISAAAPVTTTPATHYNNGNIYDIPKQRPSNSDNTQSTEKPNVFVNLNRSKDNPYKHHKLLHPSYTGGLKKKPNQENKPFLPTPYRPEKDEEIKIDYEPQHSFFTIEDAVTPHFPDSLKYSHHEGSDELEIITLRPQIKPTFATTPSPIPVSSTQFIQPTSSVESPATASSPRPRQKLRRRKPKPQNQQVSVVKQQQQAHDEIQQETVSEKPTRIKAVIKHSTTTVSPDTELKTRNRLNHPNRLRTRPGLTATPTIALTSSDYDYTSRPIDDDNRRIEIVTTQAISSEVTSPKSVDSSEQTDVVRHRVRLRYKNKLNAKQNTLEGTEIKQKVKDSQLSHSENENVVVKQPIDETTELNVITENPFAEIKSSLKLPNLKLRNEVFSTVPTTAESVVSSSSPALVENDDSNNNSQQKVANRPRFSIKELKRKQFLTSSAAPSATSTILTSSTSSTTSRPDGQRFNRYRLNLNRRRNETNDGAASNEEIETTRKRYSSTRFSTSAPLSSTSATVDNTVQLSTKRASLPKRTFPQRIFTKPSLTNGIEETTRPPVSSRPSRPSLRTRIQNYKKKDTSNEVVSTDQDDSIKNLNFDTIITNEQPSSTSTTTSTTGLPITRETSIMKIAAKTPSSIVNHSIKSTTINSNSVIENTLLPSSESHDTTDLVSSPSEHSQRVAELTVSANEDSTFKSANIGLLSRRIPNYFTISTDDPILPIQAFFPQIKTNDSVSR